MVQSHPYHDHTSACQDGYVSSISCFPDIHIPLEDAQYQSVCAVCIKSCVCSFCPTFALVKQVCRSSCGKLKGAFAVYLEPWHSDIFEWLDLRKKHGKEEVCLCLTGVKAGQGVMHTRLLAL